MLGGYRIPYSEENIPNTESIQNQMWRNLGKLPRGFPATVVEGSDGGTFQLQQVASRSAWLAAYALCPSLVPPLQGSHGPTAEHTEKNEVICVETWLICVETWRFFEMDLKYTTSTDLINDLNKYFFKW